MINKKKFKVKLDGFVSDILEAIEINVDLPMDATLEDLINHLEDVLGKEALGLTHEYNYRFQANKFMVFVDNCYIGHDNWESFIPNDCSSILIVPPFSDG